MVWNGSILTFFQGLSHPKCLCLKVNSALFTFAGFNFPLKCFLYKGIVGYPTLLDWKNQNYNTQLISDMAIDHVWMKKEITIWVTIENMILKIKRAINVINYYDACHMRLIKTIFSLVYFSSFRRLAVMEKKSNADFDNKSLVIIGNKLQSCSNSFQHLLILISWPSTMNLMKCLCLFYTINQLTMPRIVSVIHSYAGVVVAGRYQ